MVGKNMSGDAMLALPLDKLIEMNRGKFRSNNNGPRGPRSGAASRPAVAPKKGIRVGGARKANMARNNLAPKTLVGQGKKTGNGFRVGGSSNGSGGQKQQKQAPKIITRYVHMPMPGMPPFPGAMYPPPMMFPPGMRVRNGGIQKHKGGPAPMFVGGIPKGARGLPVGPPVNFQPAPGQWQHDRYAETDSRPSRPSGRPSAGYRVVFHNLDDKVKASDLEELCSECGHVLHCEILYDKDDRFCGEAAVVFQDRAGSQEAMKWDGSAFDGKTIVVTADGSGGPSVPSGSSLSSGRRITQMDDRAPVRGSGPYRERMGEPVPRGGAPSRGAPAPSAADRGRIRSTVVRRGAADFMEE